jgi:hypothetical protein
MIRGLPYVHLTFFILKVKYLDVGTSGDVLQMLHKLSHVS